MEQKKRRNRRRFTGFTWLQGLMGEVGVASLELDERVFE